MDLFKRHIDTFIIVTAMAAGFWNLNEKMWEMSRRMGDLEKDVAIIKTVMIMKNIMPSEVAHNHDVEEK